MAVQVILKEHINKLGEAGDIVKVKSGFARNFLIPQGIAMLATLPNLMSLKEQKAQLKADADAKRAEYEALKAKVDKLESIEIPAQVGPTGKLFGRITNQDVLDIITEKATVELARKDVRIAEHAKGVDELGEYKVEIEFGSGVQTTLSLTVIDADN